MKIKRVKWRNNPVLSNLELDFTNPENGELFDTIILAGENGTGKTTILESISTFLNIGSFEYFEFIEYIIQGKTYRAIPPSDGNTRKNFFDIVDTDGVIDRIRTDRSNNFDQIETNARDIRSYGCVFSKARSDYKTKQITSTTTKVLDADKYDADTEDDFTSLKQLLVDIQNQDNSEYAELNKSLAARGQSPESWPNHYTSSKIYRFKSAFDNFFDQLKYDKVVDSNNQKAILFNKNGKPVSIDDLSTGEKQIVFRGSYLLKNSKKLTGAAIMIDEPELSMHPKWQKKILNYYKKLFTTENHQIAQLFVATHSEYVLEEGLSDRTNNLVIVLNDVGGNIQSRKIIAPSVLPTITSAETNYLAFDIVSNDYHIELYGWLQQKESRLTITACDLFIQNHHEYDSHIHSKPSSFGTTHYQTLSTYIRNAIDHPGPGKNYSEEELRKSIELLIILCR